MATWWYIKGSEKDFEGAPDWATLVVTGGEFKNKWYLESFEEGKMKHSRCDGVGVIWNALDYLYSSYTVIAQRERVTSVNDDRLTHDMVNHPSHYTQGGIECIDAITAATVGKTGIEAVCVANVIKYLWRYEEKNGLEDVKKARWYLERLINELSEGDK